MSKEQKEEKLEKEEAVFSMFLPDFTNLEKVTTNAVVKSNCIVYPVFNLKRPALHGGSATKSKHNNCKMIIQLDIPRNRIG